MNLSTRQKQIAAGVGGVAVLAVGAFFLFGGRSEDLPFVGGPSICPLTGTEIGEDDAELVDRPALAVKVENNPVARPLSGLDDAEIVYEEAVEGGLTRFIAFYHCTDSKKVGPVRSTRLIDPAYVTPITKILAAAGGNGIVLEAVDKAGIILIGESEAGKAMRRVERPGITSEHTLYGTTERLRAIGAKKFDEAPPDDLFEFGALDGGGKKVKAFTLTFGGAEEIRYEWSGGKWKRFDGGEPLMMDPGNQIAVDNVIVEMHETNLSKTIFDVAGTPSVEIADLTGSGRAVLFRDGRAIEGRWTREKEDEPMRFETKGGEPMVLKAGTTWIELLPNEKGEVNGTFEIEKA